VILFPAFSAEENMQAMLAYRQAFSTPRESGKRDPEGGHP
jgi:hypothetical protein